MANKLDVIEILIKACKESEGKTIDIILDHRLPGITEKMYQWWGQNMGDTRHYKMWHPDHVSFEFEKNSDPSSPPIANPTEKMGKYGPSTMRFTFDPSVKYPFEPVYKNYNLTIHLSPDSKIVLSMLCNEYEERNGELFLHQIYRWPAKAPPSLVEALRQHVIEEVGNFPRFLPELYKKEALKK